MAAVNETVAGPELAVIVVVPTLAPARKETPAIPAGFVRRVLAVVPSPKEPPAPPLLTANEMEAPARGMPAWVALTMRGMGMSFPTMAL